MSMTGREHVSALLSVGMTGGIWVPCVARLCITERPLLCR